MFSKLHRCRVVEWWAGNYHMCLHFSHITEYVTPGKCNVLASLSYTESECRCCMCIWEEEAGVYRENQLSGQAGRQSNHRWHACKMMS